MSHPSSLAANITARFLLSGLSMVVPDLTDWVNCQSQHLSHLEIAADKTWLLRDGSSKVFKY